VVQVLVNLGFDTQPSIGSNIVILLGLMVREQSSAALGSQARAHRLLLCCLSLPGRLVVDGLPCAASHGQEVKRASYQQLLSNSPDFSTFCPAFVFDQFHSYVFVVRGCWLCVRCLMDLVSLLERIANCISYFGFLCESYCSACTACMHPGIAHTV
jgi:hypothetical protein